MLAPSYAGPRCIPPLPVGFLVFPFSPTRQHIHSPKPEPMNREYIGIWEGDIPRREVCAIGSRLSTPVSKTHIGTVEVYRISASARQSRAQCCGVGEFCCNFFRPVPPSSRLV